MERILVIDDDRELCELLAEYLKPEGFEVEAAHTGEDGLAMVWGGQFRIVVLDIMLPGGRNGFDILQQIRARSEIPVIMLTARGEDVDRIVGLEMGADDYLPKPFNPRELIARIRAVLRRSRYSRPDGGAAGGIRKYRIGDVELDLNSRTVLRGGETVRLTGVEFQVLEVLLRNYGQVVSRDDLANEVLNRSLSAVDRSIDVHVSNLRRKLGPEPGGAERIKAIRGTGYIYTCSFSTGDEGRESGETGIRSAGKQPGDGSHAEV
jgi:two-component system response regulator CpxR